MGQDAYEIHEAYGKWYALYGCTDYSKYASVSDETSRWEFDWAKSLRTHFA